MLSYVFWRRAAVLLSLLFVFSVLLFAPAAAQDLKKARALAAEKKYDQSISEYLLLLKKEPRNAKLLKEAALVYRANKMPNEAANLLAEAVKSEPRNPELVLELGKTFAETGKVDDAVRSFRKAIQLDSLATTPREELGKLYEETNRYEDAVDAYKGVIKLDSRRFDIYKKIGDILRMKLGREFDAVGYYKIVLAAAPNSKEAREIKESMGKKEEEVVLVETLKPRPILDINRAFSDSYDQYKPSEKAVSFLSAVKTPTVIEAYLGTWCPDSEKHVPKLIKLLEKVSNPLINARYIGVDRKMTTPSGKEKGKDIKRVPTFIVYQGNREVGRIVETPKTTIEDDLVEIFRQAK
ncbi:MAG: tetratricopeptide repeat protein [Candidatus Eisenbacteria bacterium]|nr:tetratricopeptide repeat protein [Candidatus Eisenbacteria bacterium]